MAQLTKNQRAPLLCVSTVVQSGAVFNLKIDQSFFGEVFLLNLILKLHYSTWNWNFWRTCSLSIVSVFLGGRHVLPDFFAELLGEKLLLKPVGPNLEVSITKTKLWFGALVSHGWHVFLSSYFFGNDCKTT